MTTLTQKEMVQELALQFTSNFLGKYTVEQAISMMLPYCFAYGRDNPSLVQFYSNDETDVEASARLRFCDFLTNKITIMQFVEDVFRHAATQVAYEKVAENAAREAAKASV
jgi:hypothetical protein